MQSFITPSLYAHLHYMRMHRFAAEYPDMKRITPEAKPSLASAE